MKPRFAPDQIEQSVSIGSNSSFFFIRFKLHIKRFEQSSVLIQQVIHFPTAHAGNERCELQGNFIGLIFEKTTSRQHQESRIDIVIDKFGLNGVELRRRKLIQLANFAQPLLLKQTVPEVFAISAIRPPRQQIALFQP